MPGLSGIDATREIKRRGLTAKVILLTMHNDTDTANQAIKAGAMGYVLKDNAFEDLIYALRAVASGGTFISPSLASGLLKNTEAKKETELLTKREREVLVLIASGLSNRQIAEKLFISIKTVETHRARIMQALDLHKAADLVRYAIKNGLLEKQAE
jgi:DNA-binding NarL/FixJ family response regulator